MITVALQKMLVYLGVAAIMGFLALRLINLEPDPTLVSQGTPTDVVANDIIILVEKLNRISIDKSIFSSPVFISLVDYNVNLFPEAQGRPNPFATIGSDAVAAPVSAGPTAISR